MESSEKSFLMFSVSTEKKAVYYFHTKVLESPKNTPDIRFEIVQS